MPSIVLIAAETRRMFRGMRRVGFQIGRRGRQAVEDWLVERGYGTNGEGNGSRAKDIVALHALGSLLVRVRASVAPNVPAALSPDESRAAPFRYDPWEARVVVDDDGRLVGDILWRWLAG